jgi:hypothetical protein
MANSDKNIVITPNISSTTADPRIVFSGADASTGPQNITLQAYPTNSGTLSFEGSAGQLFSISNTMSGTIFSANDVSGIPSIEVLDTGLVKIAQYSGNLLVGSGTDSGIAKVQITGDQTVSGKTIYGPNTTWGAYLQVGGSSREYVDNVTYASVAASDGNLHLDAASGKDLYLNYYDGSSVRIGNGANGYGAVFNTSGALTLNGDLTVGNSANSSNIYMFDSDNTTRRIHCNSNQIGFLNSSNGWGAYCDNSGNWYANNISGSTSGTNTGDQTSVSGSSGSCSGNAATATRAAGNFYIDSNYGRGIVGLYSSTRYQGVFAMGDAYKLADDGTTTGSLYGMAWSHPNAGGAAGNLSSHGLLLLQNGGFMCALSTSIVASANITAYSDERLKTNWRDMPENFVARLAQVKVGIYDRTDEEDVTQVGVSAQSLQKLLPQAIMTANDDMQTLSVNYGGAALASAVELAKDNVELRARIEKLEALVESLLSKE